MKTQNIDDAANRNMPMRPKNNGGIEYIRKDALLEWAKESGRTSAHVAKESKTESWRYFNFGREDFAKDLINKINEL